MRMKNFYDTAKATVMAANDEPVLMKDIIEAARSASEVFFRSGRKRIPAMDVNDLSQETFYRAMKGITRYDSRRASLKTWVSRIALYYLIDFERREKRRTVWSDAFASLKTEEVEDDTSPLLAAYWGEAYEADRELLTEEALGRIEAAFAKLCESRRMVVKLAGEGFKVREIAMITGWNPSKVSVLLHRGRNDLEGYLGRDTLQDYGIAA